MAKKETVAQDKSIRIYEAGFHLVSSLAEEQVPAEYTKIKDVIEKNGGQVITEEMPKLRPLAYEIKKSFEGVYKTFDKAYFGFIKFELAEDADVKIIDTALKNNLSVLRHILVKTARENTIFSPKMGVWGQSEPKARVSHSGKPEGDIAAPASVEEVDKAVDALVSEEVKA